MSDQSATDDELPEFLSEAILSAGPPAEAVDLVKGAFSWRTIDVDLLELSFDSALEPAGVRDPDATRTLELAADAISVVIEIGPDDRVTGQLVPAASGTVELQGLDRTITARIEADGRFTFDEALTGPVRLRVTTATTFGSETFVV